MYNSRNTRTETPLKYFIRPSIQHNLPNHRKDWPVSRNTVLPLHTGQTHEQSLSTDSNQENGYNRIMLGIIFSSIGVHFVAWIVKSTEKLKDFDRLGIISTTIRDICITILCLLMSNPRVIRLHRYAYFCITMICFVVNIVVEFFLVVNREFWLALLGITMSVFGISIALCPTKDSGIFMFSIGMLATHGHKLFTQNVLLKALVPVLCFLFASFHAWYKNNDGHVILLSNEFQRRRLQEEAKRKAIGICMVGLATGCISDAIWISLESNGEVPIIYLSIIHVTIHSILWPILSHVFLNVIPHLIMVHQSHQTEADHCGNKKTLVILFIANMSIKVGMFIAAKYIHVS